MKPVFLLFLVLFVPLLNAQTAQEWLDKAYNATDPKLQIDWYTKALALDPQNAGAYNNRAIAWDNLGNTTKALADYNKSIQIDPKNKLTYFNRSSLYFNLGNYDQAIENLNQCLRLDPNYLEAYIELARNKLQKCDTMSLVKKRVWLNAALQDLATARQKGYPKLEKLFTMIGNIKVGFVQREEAILEYSRAIAAQSDYEDAFLQRGVQHAQLGRYEIAITDYTSALKLKPDEKWAYFNRGYAWYNLGKLGKSALDFQSFLKFEKENPVEDNLNSCFMLANIKTIQKKYEEALQYLYKAQNIDPQNNEVYFRKGNILMTLKRNKEAKDSFDKAIYYGYSDYEVYQGRGDAYFNLKLFPQAINDYKEALRKSPFDQNLREKLKQLSGKPLK